MSYKFTKHDLTVSNQYGKKPGPKDLALVSLHRDDILLNVAGMLECWNSEVQEYWLYILNLI